MYQMWGYAFLSRLHEIAPVATSDSQRLYLIGLCGTQKVWIDAELVCESEIMGQELSVASRARSAAETSSCAADTASK
jgi:hypothetical protein